MDPHRCLPECPDRNSIGLEHFPDSPEVLRYDPGCVFGQTKPVLLDSQQHQSALELLDWWIRVRPALQQGEHRSQGLRTP